MERSVVFTVAAMTIAVLVGIRLGGGTNAFTVQDAATFIRGCETGQWEVAQPYARDDAIFEQVKSNLAVSRSSVRDYASYAASRSQSFQIELATPVLHHQGKKISVCGVHTNRAAPSSKWIGFVFGLEIVDGRVTQLKKHQVPDLQLCSCAPGLALKVLEDCNESQPRLVALLSWRQGRSLSSEALQVALTWSPRPDDVFVVTYPKSGTTWLTQISHGLRSHGDMSFDEITSAVPWDVAALDIGYNLSAPQAWSPRLFKSHLPVGHVATGGRYIYLARDPLEVFRSNYDFIPAYAGIRPDALEITEFYNNFFELPTVGSTESKDEFTVWGYFLRFWKRRNQDNVLLVFYEDLKEDFDTELSRIAAFFGVTLDEDLKRIVTEQSTHSFMKQHIHLFDDHLVHKFARFSMGLSDNDTVAFSKVGRKARDLSLSEVLLSRMDEKWKQVITSQTGLANYTAMRQQARSERPT